MEGEEFAERKMMITLNTGFSFRLHCDQYLGVVPNFRPNIRPTFLWAWPNSYEWLNNGVKDLYKANQGTTHPSTLLNAVRLALKWTTQTHLFAQKQDLTLMYPLGLVWMLEIKESDMKIIEKLRGNMVISIYPRPTSFLSLSHTFFGSTNFTF